MKLFYKAGACSLAPHIVMAELNMVYEIEAVDIVTKQCASGDYRKINPKGSVPAIRMDNGEILSEGAVISQYLADQKMDSGLIPKYGTLLILIFSRLKSMSNGSFFPIRFTVSFTGVPT